MVRSGSCRSARGLQCPRMGSFRPRPRQELLALGLESREISGVGVGRPRAGKHKQEKQWPGGDSSSLQGVQATNEALAAITLWCSQA